MKLLILDMPETHILIGLFVIGWLVNIVHAIITDDWNNSLF